MPVKFFSGGNSAVWTKYFIELGGFSQLGSGGDNSLVLSLEQKGLYVHFIPHLTVLHRNSKGIRSAIKEAYISGKLKNEKLRLRDYLIQILNFKKGGVGRTLSTSSLNYFLNSIHLTGMLRRKERI